MTGILATFTDVRTVKTRGVLQLVLELPLEHADAAMKALGGYPLPSESRWVGIALAKEERETPTKKSKRAWADMTPTEQAGMRAHEPLFWEFVHCETGGEPCAAKAIRTACLVESRSEFNTSEAAADRWQLLEARYQQFLTDKRYEGSRTK